MKKVYFVSDAHLGIESQDKEHFKQTQLLTLFKHLEKDAQILVIMGDLFDFWFDYRWVVPRPYLPILNALKQLTDCGIQVMYCIGNHDFWLGSFFSQDLHIQVERHPVNLEINGRKFYISHGDGLNKKDIGYRLLKTILRCPFTRFFCQSMHPDFVFTIARWLSGLSRNYRPNHDNRQPYVDKAMELFDEGFDFVIFGHTHDPMILEHENHTYVNTGEWMDAFTYAVYENDRLQLKYWIKEQGHEAKEKVL